MKKINVAELLKDCPKGMELDCTMFDNVTFEEVITVRGFDDKIRVKIILSTHDSDGMKDEINLTEFGTYTDDETAKCVIFPKGKTSWEGFQRPFKDGEILSNGICICLYNGNENGKYYGCYVGVGHIDFPNYFINHTQNSYFTKENSRLATIEEKERLFKAIEENGYKWNAETRTLEKLVPNKFDITALIPFESRVL